MGLFIFIIHWSCTYHGLRLYCVVNYASAMVLSMAALRVPIWIFFILLALIVICLLVLLVFFHDPRPLILALLLIPSAWGLAYQMKRAGRPISISTMIDVPPSRIWMAAGILVIALLTAALRLWLGLTA